MYGTEMKSHPAALATDPGEHRFRLKNVSKSYGKSRGRGERGERKVLDNVDLTVYENTINAVMGKSGCGKSTLARIIMRLEHPDSGEILYKGNEIEAAPMKEFRRKNRVMFQDPFLSVNPYFKVKKILEEPLTIRANGDKRLNRKEIEEKTGPLLELLEIPDALLNRYPRELSGGQLQRVVLGRALVPEPEFLILDEPFSSLDEIMAARLMHGFKKIFRRLGIGVLYISHHKKRVHFLADRVSRLTAGCPC